MFFTVPNSPSKGKIKMLILPKFESSWVIPIYKNLLKYFYYMYSHESVSVEWHLHDVSFENTYWGWERVQWVKHLPPSRTSEFDLWDVHGRKREPSPTSYHLISTGIPLHLCENIHKHTHIHMYQIHVKIFKSICTGTQWLWLSSHQEHFNWVGIWCSKYLCAVKFTVQQGSWSIVYFLLTICLTILY